MKHGIYTSVKKGEDIGYFGKVSVYENGRCLWSEILWNTHRLTRKDALQDAIEFKAELLAVNNVSKPALIFNDAA